MEAIFISGFFLAAFLLAVAVVAGLVFVIGASRSLSSRLFPLILVLIALGGMVGVLLSGRDLSLIGIGFNSAVLEGGTLSRWVNRAFIVGIVALSLGVLVDSFVSRTRRPMQGRALFYGFLAFYITQSLLPSAFGTEPAFLHNQLYPLLVMAAAYVSVRPAPEQLQAVAKWVLFALIATSLVAAVVMPSLALQRNYKGWVPGLNVRLWGLATHANVLGPAALTLLLLEYLQPTRKRLTQVLLVLSALTVLVLAQSKTTWLVGILCLALLVVYHKMPQWSGGIGRLPMSVVLQMMVMLLGIVGVLVAALAIDTDRLIGRVMASNIGANLTTASGRDLIWATALNEWNRNWLFGYGPLVWGDEYRFQHGMFNYAYHAHNQVLQSVSMGGSFALLGLIVYLWLLVRYAFRVAHPTKGVSLAMVLVILVRGVSEVPLPQHAVFGVDFLLHLVLFMIIVLHASQRRSTNPHAPSDSHAVSGRHT